MVEKVSVNVKILSLNAEHSFLIPWDMRAEDAVMLIVELLRDEYPGIGWELFRRNCLMQQSSGKLLNNACSLKQQGIVHGERLLLI